MEEICKEVTDIPGEYLVNPMCQCPRDYSCPTVSPKNVETVLYDQEVGIVFQHSWARNI